MINEILTLVGTMSYWVHFFVLLAMAGNLIWLRYLVWPKVKGWILQRRHEKMVAMLRRSPTALMKEIREKNVLVAHLEDTVLKLKTELDRAQEREEEIRAEVKRLVQRNVLMANEIRCDIAAETQVLRPKWSARF